MASDSRSNAGYDQVNVCRKMHTFVRENDRVLVLLTSGSLSLTQSIVELLRRDFDAGQGLARAGPSTTPPASSASRCVASGTSTAPRSSGMATSSTSTSSSAASCAVRSRACSSVYPEGNPLSATEDSPYLQIGESKYGRPILDRGIRHDRTTLEEAAKYALISLDSTMRSNATVGPPIELLVYGRDELRLDRYRRLEAEDPDLKGIRAQWEQALRKAVLELPAISFRSATE